MNALNIKDAKSMYLGTGSSRVAIRSVWIGSNLVWPALGKPVITEAYYQFIEDPTPAYSGYYVSFVWGLVTGATEYWIYVNGVKRAELGSSENSYECGVFNYGQTVSVQVLARGAGASQRMSDTTNITIEDPAYEGNTISFELVASRTNLYEWTSGNDVKVYACFPTWLNSARINDFISRYYQHGQTYPSVMGYTKYSYSGVGSAVIDGMSLFVQPVINTVEIYPGTITKLSDGSSVRYDNIILLDPMFLPGESVVSCSFFDAVITWFSTWKYSVYGVDQKYRFYPTGGVGGLEDALPEQNQGSPELNI